MFLWRNKKDISIFLMKKAPYLLLCKAQLEYAAPVWDSHTQGDVTKIEIIATDKALFSSKKCLISQ